MNKKVDFKLGDEMGDTVIASVKKEAGVEVIEELCQVLRDRGRGELKRMQLDKSFPCRGINEPVVIRFSMEVEWLEYFK